MTDWMIWAATVNALIGLGLWAWYVYRSHELTLGDLLVLPIALLTGALLLVFLLVAVLFAPYDHIIWRWK